MLQDKNLIQLIGIALQEDLGNGDITTDAIINPLKIGEAVFLCKEEGIFAGERFLHELLQYYNKGVVFTPIKKDGEVVYRNEPIGKLSGKISEILKIERLSLNFIQRMSGIATLTYQFVEKVKDTNAKILDTRKTTPGLRVLEKEAVRIGGGENHRFGLYDMFLIKDNHIIAAGGITEAVELVKKYKELKKLPFKIEVETKKISEIREALECKIDRIMLDNFSIDEMNEAVEIISGAVEIEVSGGVSLDTVSEIAKTGVDYISIGSLTHSAKSLDISLEL